MIRINEAEPGSNERIITIVGTEAATQNAQYLLQKRFVRLLLSSC